MALVDLKSNLASFRTDFKTPTLENKVNTSKYNIDDANISIISEFNASGATFSSKLNNFDYTKGVFMSNSKFTIGTATLNNQLGNGSPFRYLKSNTLTSKIFSVQGYSTSNTYNSVVNSISGQSNKSLLYTKAIEQNSPSAIDEQYKKFNLRDDAYNPTYMKQPFVVRGIQRKGNETPQYWGFGSRSGFDDGLIRGGVVTVADRVVSDTVRIAKFMASPKGLLWIVKQVGLGLTNAKVEAVGGTFGRQTRIHTGVTSLLSVVGAPFGLHFTRHGLPFANEIASYGNVIKTKQLPLVGNPSYSRLVDLQNEFDAGKFYNNKIIEGLSKVKIVKTKTLGSAILSGLGGPGSVYGIGFTQIRRVVDTKTDAVARAEKLNFTQTYGVEAQYASTISKGILKTSIDSDKNKRTIDDIENNKPVLIGVANAPKSIYSKANKSNFGKSQTPGAGKVGSIETNAGKVTAYPNSPDGNINNYITMAYGKIPKNSSDKSALKGDFRNALEKDEKGFTGIPNDYTKNSLESRYGFGNLGDVNAVRTDPNKFLVSSADFNKKPKNEKDQPQFVLINKPDFRGDKVTAINIASPGKDKQVYAENGQDLITFYFEDGVEGTNVMPFRCTMTGYSDSFTPGWDRIDIMGRPDGAYLYTTFERSVSFNFTVAALSRSEMIPMWRKLNYLSTYTMPDFNNSATRPSGPFMRISIGSLFKNTPGFISSLTYTVPDDATWDIAEDAKDTKDAKQLPMIVDVAMSFTIVGDFRPQMMGRAYSLQGDRDWLKDSVTKLGSKSKSKSK